MKKDRLKAYRDAYAGMLFECAGYAKVIGRNDDATVLFQLSIDFMGWNQTQKGIDKRAEKKYDDNSGTQPQKKEEVKEMKAFEYLISWDVPGGYQYAYALVNAKSEKDAVGLILSRIPYHADATLKNKYPYNAALKNNIKIWYFSKDGEEHREIY